MLPYPITFLCTDFISELYGRARANAVVWTGLLLNVSMQSPDPFRVPVRTEPRRPKRRAIAGTPITSAMKIRRAAFFRVRT